MVHVNNALKGSKDKEVLRYAVENDRILLTFDDDFTRLQKKHSGIIYITRRDRYSKVAEAVKEILEIVSKKDIENELYMVSP